MVLHGGPGAAGDVGALARRLSSRFRAIEPWQRASGSEPLTVAAHIADLHEVVRAQSLDGRPAIVGHSWGAMLALCFAAAYPDYAGPLVLIGCGTFDRESRARLKETIESRMGDSLRRKIERVQASSEQRERTYRFYQLISPLYAYDADISAESNNNIQFSERAHLETWNDMMRLQDNGFYPSAFAAIKSPVLMLHGAYDPHPGIMIRDSLKPYIPLLEYREWECCGHKPWIERQVREDFFSVMIEWLTERLSRSRHSP
jgi:pimeloyl-ACP methyl ester carboxylesterase